MINRGPGASAFWAVTQGSLFSKQSTTNILNKSNEWLQGLGQLCFSQFHTAWGNEGYKTQEKTKQKPSSLPPSSVRSSDNLGRWNPGKKSDERRGKALKGWIRDRLCEPEDWGEGNEISIKDMRFFLHRVPAGIGTKSGSLSSARDSER